MTQKKELTSLHKLSQFANPEVRHRGRGNEPRKMKNPQKSFFILSVESD